MCGSMSGWGSRFRLRVAVLRTRGPRRGGRVTGGQHHTLHLPIPLNAWQERKTPATTITLIDQLLGTHTYSQVASGLVDTALVVSAEVFSRLLDWSDRSTCVLFGDGAGAVVVSAGEHADLEPKFVLGSDGSGAQALCLPAGGSQIQRHPIVIDPIPNAKEGQAG